jgi:hypothetical protein
VWRPADQTQAAPPYSSPEQHYGVQQSQPGQQYPGQQQGAVQYTQPQPAQPQPGQPPSPYAPPGQAPYAGQQGPYGAAQPGYGQQQPYGQPYGAPQGQAYAQQPTQQFGQPQFGQQAQQGQPTQQGQPSQQGQQAQFGQGQYGQPGQPPYGQASYGQQQAGQQSPWAGQQGGWAQQPGAAQQPTQQWGGRPDGQQPWAPGASQEAPGGGGKSRLPMIIGAAAVVVLALVGVLGFVSPGFFNTRVLDANAVQSGVQQVLSQDYDLEVQTVTCPQGQEVVPDATFECTAVVDGDQVTVPIKITSVDGNYEVGRPA